MIGATFVLLAILSFLCLISSTQNRPSNPCNEAWEDLELFLPVFLGAQNRRDEWRSMFLYTFSHFWPIEKSNTKLMIMLDEEERQNSYIPTIEAAFQSHEALKNRSRIVFNEVPPVYYDNSGWKRQQYLMMYADNFTSAEYVGFVDTDCMFITYVHSNDIFENGKPVINGKTGNPHKHSEKEEPIWKEIIRVTYELTGIKEPMKCMSYFPVVIKTKHIAAFRKFMEDKYSMPFYDIMREHISKKWFGQFDMFCVYLFHYHHDEYVWYVHNVSPGWSYDGAFEGMNTNNSIYTPEMFYPKPRVAIHGRYHAPLIYPGTDFFYELLKIGTCISPPFPKSNPVLQKGCFPYQSEQDYQTRLFVDMYQFEKFGFYKAYDWKAMVDAVYNRHKLLASCSPQMNDTIIREIFQKPLVEEGIVYFTDFTGAALYTVLNHTLHGFQNWDAFVNRGFLDKPRQKLTPGLYHFLPRGDNLS